MSVSERNRRKTCRESDDEPRFGVGIDLRGLSTEVKVGFWLMEQ